MKVPVTALSVSVAALAAIATPASAQNGDFNLTYHVDRIPAAKLSIEACGRIVAQTARQARLSVDTQSFPKQLVSLKGGSGGSGAFVVQCIAVGGTTVTVVQGIDYLNGKGPLGNFADRTRAALQAAAR